MVTELTGHIFITALRMKNCNIMLCRAPAFLLKSERICVGERSDNLKLILLLKTATRWTFCPAYFHQHCRMSISLLTLKIVKMFILFCVWFVITFPLNIVGRNINILSWDTCLGLHVAFYVWLRVSFASYWQFRGYLKLHVIILTKLENSMFLCVCVCVWGGGQNCGSQLVFHYL